MNEQLARLVARTSDDLKAFDLYLESLPKCSNEEQVRQTFLVLAASAFSEAELATDLALGSEYKLSFQQRGLVRRGSADSYFGNLVIEFEYDLRKTRDHALDQLRGYVAGVWEADGYTREYLAVASDGLRWEVFSPVSISGGENRSAEDVLLEPVLTLGLAAPPSPSELRDFMNRLFFRKYRFSPTAENIARDFGLLSPVYIAARRTLLTKMNELHEDPQLQVLYEAWRDSLQLSYGYLDTDSELFVRHTYLAMFARILVWASIERHSIARGELISVLSGQYFRGRGVANLVEDDFFHWHAIPSATDAMDVWVGLARQLDGYELTSVGEDILKPIYEDLVDPATRHDLGEFYTPDWLAERTTERLLSSWSWSDGRVPSVLDPSCGSGTFLRTVIDHVRERSSLVGAPLLDGILSNVVGIDVHPLAVTIGKATYLLAIKDLLGQTQSPITIPVFLANTLQMPELDNQPSLFGDTVPLSVRDLSFPVPTDFLHFGSQFDATIEDVTEVARTYGKVGTKLEDVGSSLKARIGPRFADYHRGAELIEALTGISRRIAQLTRERKDSIHGFMLKNHYRPAMLRHSFDYVIGNPPWLTVNDIATPEYKDLVVRLANMTKIAPRSAGEQGHTELATIFLAQVAREFLRPSAEGSESIRIGLVMPRSLMTASHHRNLRQGAYTAQFQVQELWDLVGVTPLFNIPACVVFANARLPSRHPKIAGLLYEGRLPAKDVPWRVAVERLTVTSVEFALGFLGRRSAWKRAGTDGTPTPDVNGEPMSGSSNAYTSRFQQGAILYPQTLLIVEPALMPTSRTGVMEVVTNEEAARTAKLLKDARVLRVVDVKNLFLTAAADHIMPYAVGRDLWTTILPVLGEPGSGHFDVVGGDDLRRAGRLDTADWLDWAEKKWASVRKEGDDTPLWKRLDHMGHLSAQANAGRYYVLYAAIGNRPVSAYIDAHKYDMPFVARDMTYWTTVDSEAEAAFLVTMLNSEFAAATIRDWMTVGLFGPRHIHKRVLDVPWPEFDRTDPLHSELSSSGKALADAAAALVPHLPEQGAGRQRTWLRSALPSELLGRVERLVADISGDSTIR